MSKEPLCAQIIINGKRLTFVQSAIVSVALVRLKKQLKKGRRLNKRTDDVLTDFEIKTSEEILALITGVENEQI